MSAELLVKKVDSVTDVTVTDASGKQYPVETVGDYWKCKVDEYGEYTTNFKVNGVQSKPRKTIVDTCKQYYPVSFSGTLNQTSWSDIRLASDMGIASTIWAVGDTKAVNDISVFILGFDHNVTYEGENRIHFSGYRIGGFDVAVTSSRYGEKNAPSESINDRYIMNAYEKGNDYGWEQSYMRTRVLNSNALSPSDARSDSFLGELPNDLKQAIKRTKKYTNNGTLYSPKVTATEDWLFLFSEFELTGNTNTALSEESSYQKQYDYYKKGHGIDRGRTTNKTLNTNYWLRSPNAENKVEYCCVNSGDSGSPRVRSYNSNYNYGVAPCFCV